LIKQKIFLSNLIFFIFENIDESNTYYNFWLICAGRRRWN